MANSDQTIETPDNFFEAIQEHLDIKCIYDMAASVDNFKCSTYFDETDDSLHSNCDWPKDGWCWLNPTFKNLTKWINKCYEEKEKGAKIITIWPLSGDLNQITAWENCQVFIIHGRIWPEVRSCMVCVWEEGITPGIFGLRWDRKTGVLTDQWE